ncbi:MAG: CpaF family protein, partial [Marinobacter sp.]|nr:CpaF family protein [Marinobacter sp.]
MNLRPKLGSANGKGNASAMGWTAPVTRSAEEYGNLSDEEQAFKESLFERLVKTLDLSLLGSLGDREARIQIQQVCEALMREESLTFNSAVRQRIISDLQDEVLGLGPLEALLADNTVSDILVNGTRPIFVER